jgi:magnesium-transporting ATPase (P-type)
LNQKKAMSPYLLNSTVVLQQLKTNATSGLSQSEASRRRQYCGDNSLAEQPGESFWQIL